MNRAPEPVCANDMRHSSPLTAPARNGTVSPTGTNRSARSVAGPLRWSGSCPGRPFPGVTGPGRCLGRRTARPWASHSAAVTA